MDKSVSQSHPAGALCRAARILQDHRVLAAAFLIVRPHRCPIRPEHLVFEHGRLFWGRALFCCLRTLRSLRPQCRGEHHSEPGCQHSHGLPPLSAHRHSSAPDWATKACAFFLPPTCLAFSEPLCGPAPFFSKFRTRCRSASTVPRATPASCSNLAIVLSHPTRKTTALTRNSQSHPRTSTSSVTT